MKPQPQKRRRGVILTPQGFNKLLAAKSEAESCENCDKRFTLEALSFRTGLDPDTLMKIFSCKVRVDKQTLNRCFQAFKLQLEPNDYQHPIENPPSLAIAKEQAKLPNRSDWYFGTDLDSDTLRKVFACEVGVDKTALVHQLEATVHKLSQPDAAISTQHLIQNPKSNIQNRIDWGAAPDVSVFYGRTEELATLKRWILEERCRLVTIVGMVGMGKTCFSVKLAQQIQNEFEFVIWRSLRNTPPIQDLLAELILFFSGQEESTDVSPLPDTVDRSILRLMEYLKKHRCLLILDNVESILSNANRAEYDGYGQLFRCLGDSLHQSCLILTTREKPKWLAYKEGETLPLRSLKLTGLQPTDVKAIFQGKGCSCESLTLCGRLTNYYAGNPLLLKLVSTSICNLFDGRISEFINQKVTIFGEIDNVFEQHFKGLSEEEKAALKWLAINRKPASFAEMRSQLIRSLSPQTLLAVLESLEERSLIEKKAALFFMQPVVMDYVADQLVPGNITQFPLKYSFSSVG